MPSPTPVEEGRIESGPEVYGALFPRGDGREYTYVQTRWAEGWSGLAYGFGQAAEKLTEVRREFYASIDQVGMAIFFLQRHRVELILKGLLDEVGAPVLRTHDLFLLWDAVERAVKEIDDELWTQFAEGTEALIAALQVVDESSFVFRYPTDKAGQPMKRPAFIDLDAVQRRVLDFDYASSWLIDHLRWKP